MSSKILCPKCQSDQFSTYQENPDNDNTGSTTLSIGLGATANNNIKMTCLSCGYTFSIAEATLVNNPAKASKHDQQIINDIKTKGKLLAVKAYKEATECTLLEAKNKIDAVEKQYGITPAKGTGGCAGVLLVLLVIIGALLVLVLR
jgi:hypothetical protein